MDTITDHIELDAERAIYAPENRAIPRYRCYARGDQDLMLTDYQKLVLGGACPDDRADNICHQVISEGADRLELLGFDVPEGELGAKELTAFIDSVWVKNALPDLFGEQSYNTIRDGNAAVLLEWVASLRPDPLTGDFGRVKITLQEWWDGRQGVWIFPGDSVRPPFAVKEVVTYPNGRRMPGLRLRYVYYEDRIERFESQSAGGGGLGGGSSSGGAASLAWEIHPTEEAPDGITAWEKGDGSPLHIPLIHFPNAGRMWGIQGLSDLAGGLIAAQNDLNLIDASHVAAAILTAFQEKNYAGYTPVPDPAKPGMFLAPAFNAEPGSMNADPSKDFRAWVLPAGDVSQIINSYTHKVTQISRMSRTPRHAITGGDWPSGDALVRAEMPAVNAARRRSNKWGPAWATVMHRACEMQNVFGKGNLNENALLTARWADFEKRDALYVQSVKRAELQNEELQAAVEAGVAADAATIAADIKSRLDQSAAGAA